MIINHHYQGIIKVLLTTHIFCLYFFQPQKVKGHHLYGCFQKYGKTSQIINFNRVFHYFHHPFWGTPIFGNTHIWLIFPVCIGQYGVLFWGADCDQVRSYHSGHATRGSTAKRPTRASVMEWAFGFLVSKKASKLESCFFFWCQQFC